MLFMVVCKANGGLSQVCITSTYDEGVAKAKSEAESSCHINQCLVVPVDTDKVVAVGKQPLHTPWGDRWL